ISWVTSHPWSKTYISTQLRAGRRSTTTTRRAVLLLLPEPGTSQNTWPRPTRLVIAGLIFAKSASLLRPSSRRPELPRGYRSEERRVGKECRSWVAADDERQE